MGDYISGGGGGQNERVIRFKPECLFNLQLVDWEIIQKQFERVSYFISLYFLNCFSWVKNNENKNKNKNKMHNVINH